MINKRKSVLAILIALVMTIVLVPITVFAGTGTQEDPFVNTDKNNGAGANSTCLVLYQCDENGNIIQSLEKFDTTVSAGPLYSTSKSESTTIYVKLAYKDGSELNPNDWVDKNGTAVQTAKVAANFKTDANYDVKINNISFKDATSYRVWLDIANVYRIDFPEDTNEGTHYCTMRFYLGDGTTLTGATFCTKFVWDNEGKTNKMGIDAATIADIPDQAYTGEAIEPALDISYNGTALVKDTDYTVAFENNVEVGTATATITGIGDYDWHVTKTFNIVSAEPAAPTFKLTSSEGESLLAKKNTTLTVGVENGNVEDYTYKFIVYNKTTNQWYRLRDFDAANTFDWYTGPGGEKTLYADVKQGDEIIKRVELGVNVTESTLKVDSFTISPEGDLPAKSQAKLTATASGGTGEYQYKFIVFNATTNQWYKLKDFGPESEFDWYTGPAGTKTLYVDVKDANGVVVRQALENIVVK